MSLRHIAFVDVSGILLAEALHFPTGTVIHDVKRNNNPRRAVFEFTVEHADLPVVAEDATPPHVSPVITRISEHFEFDWGI